jgi:hypothetical protein
MSTRFLSSGGTFSDGTADIYVRTIRCSTQGPNLPVKTDSLGIMQSILLDIADTNGLQAALNGLVSNPLAPGIPFNVNQNQITNAPSIHSTVPMTIVTPAFPNGGVTISGANGATASLITEHNAVIGENLIVQGGVDANGDVNISGNLSCSSDLQVDSIAHFSGAITADGSNLVLLCAPGTQAIIAQSAGAGPIVGDPVFRTHNVYQNVLNHVAPDTSYNNLLANGQYSYPMTIPAFTLGPLYSGFEIHAGGVMTTNAAVGSALEVTLFVGPTGTESSVTCATPTAPPGDYVWEVTVYAHNNGPDNLIECIQVFVSAAGGGGSGSFIGQGNQAVVLGTDNLVNVQYRFGNTAVSFGTRFNFFRYF